MPQESLTDNQVLEEVRVLVRQSKIRWTYHAEQRMAQRGYDRGQIRQCLLSGYFIEEPFIPNRSGEVEYKFTFRANVDGETLDVAASLIPEKSVVVITLFDQAS